MQRECVVYLSARAFQRVFTCKIWLRHSRERALKNSKVGVPGNLNVNVEQFNISESSNLRTSQGSFSAVSKPNFASKYSLESSRRDLHKALLCTVLKAQFFVEKSLKCLLRKNYQPTKISKPKSQIFDKL